MAVAAKKLDVRIGDVVEIDGQRYDVVSDKQGGVALERAITVSSDELHERYGTRPVRTPHDRPTIVRTTAPLYEAAR
jgi:hypothetical protein